MGSSALGSLLIVALSGVQLDLICQASDTMSVACLRSCKLLFLMVSASAHKPETSSWDILPIDAWPVGTRPVGTLTVELPLLIVRVPLSCMNQHSSPEA